MSSARGYSSVRTCWACELPLPLDEFGFARKGVGGRNARCKSCMKAYHRKWYAEHRERRRASNDAGDAQRRGEVRTRLVEHLLEHPCVDCGESDPMVLQFDHVRGSKRANIADMVASACAWDTIRTEIQKCEVRCANCHQRKTIRENGWYLKGAVAQAGRASRSQ